MISAVKEKQFNHRFTRMNTDFRKEINRYKEDGRDKSGRRKVKLKGGYENEH